MAASSPSRLSRTKPHDEALRISADPGLAGQSRSALRKPRFAASPSAALLTLAPRFRWTDCLGRIAKVESAVPATGLIVSGSKRKTISLADPGILHDLLVHEGDNVIAGQVLLRLDEVQARAARSQAYVQYWSAVARPPGSPQKPSTARASVRRRPATAADADPAVAAAVQAEAHQFKVRWDAFDASVRVQDRKIARPRPKPARSVRRSRPPASS